MFFFSPNRDGHDRRAAGASDKRNNNNNNNANNTTGKDNNNNNTARMNGIHPSRVQNEKALTILQEATKNDNTAPPDALVRYLVDLTLTQDPLWCTQEELNDWLVEQLWGRVQTGQAWVNLKTNMVIYQCLRRGSVYFARSLKKEAGQKILCYREIEKRMLGTPQTNPTGAVLPSSLLTQTGGVRQPQQQRQQQDTRECWLCSITGGRQGKGMLSCSTATAATPPTTVTATITIVNTPTAETTITDKSAVRATRTTTMTTTGEACEAKEEKDGGETEEPLLVRTHTAALLEPTSPLAAATRHAENEIAAAAAASAQTPGGAGGTFDTPATDDGDRDANIFTAFARNFALGVAVNAIAYFQSLLDFRLLAPWACVGRGAAEQQAAPSSGLPGGLSVAELSGVRDACFELLKATAAMGHLLDDGSPILKYAVRLRAADACALRRIALDAMSVLLSLAARHSLSLLRRTARRGDTVLSMYVRAVSGDLTPDELSTMTAYVAQISDLLKNWYLSLYQYNRTMKSMAVFAEYVRRHVAADLGAELAEFAETREDVVEELMRNSRAKTNLATQLLYQRDQGNGRAALSPDSLGSAHHTCPAQWPVRQQGNTAAGDESLAAAAEPWRLSVPAAAEKNVTEVLDIWRSQIALLRSLYATPAHPVLEELMSEMAALQREYTEMADAGANHHHLSSLSSPPPPPPPPASSSPSSLPPPPPPLQPPSHAPSQVVHREEQRLAVSENLADAEQTSPDPPDPAAITAAAAAGAASSGGPSPPATHPAAPSSSSPISRSHALQHQQEPQPEHGQPRAAQDLPHSSDISPESVRHHHQQQQQQQQHEQIPSPQVEAASGDAANPLRSATFIIRRRSPAATLPPTAAATTRAHHTNIGAAAAVAAGIEAEAASDANNEHRNTSDNDNHNGGGDGGEAAGRMPYMVDFHGAAPAPAVQPLALEQSEEFIQSLLQEEDVVVVCNEACSANERLKVADRFQVLWGEELGAGSYGTVYRAWDELQGCYLAAKLVPLTVDAAGRVVNLRAVLSEYTVLTELKHPNVMRVVAFMVRGGTGQMFMEWMPSGSLSDVLGRARRRLREAAVSRYAQGMLRGLSYMHACGVLHRDVKPGNVLLSSEGVVKLTDFGTSCVLAGAATTLESDSLTGTAAYMAPEAVQGTYTGASDVWSAACTVLELLTGVAPWGDPETGSRPETVPLLFRIGGLEDGRPECLPHAHWRALGPAPAGGDPSGGGADGARLSAEALDFLDAALVVDRKARPTAEALLQHPFIKKYNHST